MAKFEIETHPGVKEKFKNIPPKPRAGLKAIRKLIIDTAKSSDQIDKIDEMLKWGEPSYLAKKGTTIRLSYSEKRPDQYGMYVKCTSILIPTFKVVFGDVFNYEKTRGIIFELDEKPNEKYLQKCIHAALHYHDLKKFPNLGL